MPNTTPLTDAINALTTYANETTGASDTTLSDAVETLVDGYGGGGGVSIDGIAMGTEPSGNVVLSTATNIKERKFKESPNIVSVTAPLVTVLREQIFQQCTNLESISFAGATTISSSMQFIACTKLQNVNLPNIEKLGGNMFQGCTNLEIIDLPKVTTLATPRVFYGCSKLQTVILRHTSLVAVNNDVFTNTPFAGYNSLTGTLYVPSSLVESYKTASNWSTLYNNGTMSIVAIEGSQYE